MKYCAMMAVMAAVGSALAGGNLLTNGDFEGGRLTGWGNCASPGGSTMSVTRDAHAGGYALEYTHNGIGNQAFCRNFVKVVPGAVYTIRGYLKGDAEKINIRLFNYAEGMSYVGETDIYTATKLEDWTYFEKAFSAPEDIKSVGVGLLLVKGRAYLDDVEVLEGNQIAEEPNVLWNSSFKLSYHDNGMPEFWNTGGGHSFQTFQQGTHEGKFFRMADDVASPVEGARVLYVNKVGRTYLRPGPLAGGTDYTFSVYARAVTGEAKMNLILRGMKPGKKAFTVGSEWQRLIFTAHLDRAVAEATATLEYNRNELYLAAPMLHAGKTALPWKPSPVDATFPDLFAGNQVPPPPAKIETIALPRGGDWSAAVKIDRFYVHGDYGKHVDGRYQAAAYRDGDVLKVAFEMASGKKPPVKSKPHGPLVTGNEAVELFVSPQANGAGALHFMGGRNGAYACQDNGNGQAEINEGWAFAASETAQGWRGIFEIPLSLFTQLGGEVWRMNFAVTEFDGVKPLYFSAIRAGFHSAPDFFRVTGLPRGSKVEPPAVFVEYDFYTTEKTARFRLRNAKAPVEMEVTGASVPLAQDGHVDHVTLTLSGNEGEIEIGAFADGYYEVVVKAANGEGRSHFRKFADEKHYTRINRFNETINHDGQPFFPIIFTAWMGGGRNDKIPTDWHIGELKKRNFNTVMIPNELYVLWDTRNSSEMRRTIAKKFTDAGFKLLIWSACGNLKEEGMMKAVVDYRKRHIDELAEFKKDILGWYYLDEIGANWEKSFGVKLEDYPKGYRAIKDYDPARLHFINWNHTGCTVGTKYFAEDGATDIYSLDCYTYSCKPNFGSLSAFEIGTSTLRSRMDDTHLPGIEWLQTYAYQEGIREPHQLEYRNNVYVALVNNVTGYMHFIDVPEHKELWEGMGEAYGTALKWLGMTVEPGSRLVRRGRQGQISYALWERGSGGHAFIAANTLYAPQTEAIVFTVELGSSVETVGGEGALESNGRSLSVALPTAGSAAWFITGR